MASDRHSTLRILDANLNRAAEGLRVSEDVCRFHWDLPGFAATLKELRHAVLDAVCSDPEARWELLAHRDIEGDVGRTLLSPGKQTESAATVALRNLQRAKEALRTLEEVCRIDHPAASPTLERLRYRLYSVEKGIARLPAADSNSRLALQQRVERASLCLLATSAHCSGPLDTAIAAAIAAGCEMVQLREKESDDRKRLALARRIREMTAMQGALFIVNDRPDLAALVHADGVHLGQGDLPVREARKLLGEDRLVGVSTHNLEQARRAQEEGADYIGIGPVFATKTKTDVGPTLGPASLAEILPELTIPAFAIGGIEPARAAELRQHGCTRVAVCAAILRAESIPQAVRKLRDALTSAEAHTGS